MSEKIQLDLVVLIVLFLTVFGWFVSESLSAHQSPEEYEVLQILGDEEKKKIYDSRIEALRRQCPDVKKVETFRELES